MIREGDQVGFWKNRLSRFFYTLFNAIADSPIPSAASDFRMISRYVCDTLNQLPERNLVLRAILPALGFLTATVPFAVKQRQSGRSHYSFAKSWRLMSDSLFNFSTLPLRLMRRLGLAVSVLAFLYGAFNVAMKFWGDGNVPGYTDIVASVLFLGGLVLIYLGVLGRYLEIVVDHLRLRPEYLIRPESPERSVKAEQAEPPSPGKRPDQSPSLAQWVAPETKHESP
jgi:polyisoprenyl-phosphate glycosyltransferase